MSSSTLYPLALPTKCTHRQGIHKLPLHISSLSLEGSTAPNENTTRVKV